MPLNSSADLKRKRKGQIYVRGRGKRRILLSLMGKEGGVPFFSKVVFRSLRGRKKSQSTV